MVKTCSKCGIEKNIELFHKHKLHKDGYASQCKECCKFKEKEYIEKNKQYIKIKQKIYRVKNKEKIIEYRVNNKEKRNTYHKNRINNDPLYKLSYSIRININTSFKHNNHRKKSKTQEILGCTFKEFKIYLESLFEPWMTWQNHGNWDGIPTEINTAWDIDHIIPSSSAKTEEDVYKLNHYTNFQPLCSYTNRYIKRNKQ